MTETPPDSNVAAQPGGPGTAPGGAVPSLGRGKQGGVHPSHASSPGRNLRLVFEGIQQDWPPWMRPNLHHASLSHVWFSQGQLRYLCLGDRKICLSEKQKGNDSSHLQAGSHFGRIKAKETTMLGDWLEKYKGGPGTPGITSPCEIQRRNFLPT